MAAGGGIVGFQCQFLDSVNSLFYCNKCGLVAKRLCLTKCCGESYCHACVSTYLKEDKPCPDCKKAGFQVYEQPKFQQQILALTVYCSLKKEGCDWVGRLDQLATHVDPEKGTCQYVDVACPQLCHKSVPRNKLKVHVQQECLKRSHTCQHCGFESTYEEVVGEHLPKCRYVAVQCPNICGVTCDREDLEDHLKICRLEEVQCSFGNLGCPEKFPREGEGNHFQENVHKHLHLTAVAAIKTKRLLEEKCLDQEGRIEELDKKLKEQERKFLDQEAELEDHKRQLHQQDEGIEHLKGIVEELKLKQAELEENLNKGLEKFSTNHAASDKNDDMLSSLATIVSESTRRLQVRNVSKIMSQSIQWNSPAMHSHISGYRFFLQLVMANQGLSISFFSARGKHDEQLKWPVKAVFKMVLVYANRIEGEEEEEFSVRIREWNRPISTHLLYTYHSGSIRDKLKLLVYRDSLYFGVKKVDIQDFIE